MRGLFCAPNVDGQADFFGAAFFTAVFFAAGRAAGFAGAAFAEVVFTAAFDFGVCGRVLPWLPA